VPGRRERRRKQLPDDRKETRGYWKWQALHRTVCTGRSGRGRVPVVRQTTLWLQEPQLSDTVPLILRGGYGIRVLRRIFVS